MPVIPKPPGRGPLFGGRAVVMFGSTFPKGHKRGKHVETKDMEQMQVGNTLKLILDAATFAAEKHRHQRRKDAKASPYINHPLTLARTLATTGEVTDPIVLAAALLHDTIEDTETSFSEIEDRFGREVALIVQEVSDDKELEKDERKRQAVDTVASKSREAKLVKLADKISNLRDIIASPPIEWTLERKIGYFEWAKEVIDQVRGTDQALEDEFDQVFTLGMRVFEETAV